MAALSRGRSLVLLLSLVAALDAWGLAAHGGFLPVSTLRLAAPVAALMLGAAFSHAVAKSRAERDAAVDANPSGRALFLGVAMLVATAVAWLALVQALPALWTAVAGTARAESVIVARKLPPSTTGGCPGWLEVSGAALPQAVEVCVAAAVWSQAAAGDPLQAEVKGSVLGIEIGIVHL